VGTFAVRVCHAGPRFDDTVHAYAREHGPGIELTVADLVAQL
jgi:hypothetical protein